MFRPVVHVSYVEIKQKHAQQKNVWNECFMVTEKAILKLTGDRVDCDETFIWINEWARKKGDPFGLK